MTETYNPNGMAYRVAEISLTKEKERVQELRERQALKMEHLQVILQLAMGETVLRDITYFILINYLDGYDCDGGCKNTFVLEDLRPCSQCGKSRCCADCSPIEEMDVYCVRCREEEEDEEDD